MFDRRCAHRALILITMALVSSFAARAATDLGCVQKLQQQQAQRVQLCERKFQGEHLELCKAAAAQEHDRKVKICDARETPR